MITRRVVNHGIRYYTVDLVSNLSPLNDFVIEVYHHIIKPSITFQLLSSSESLFTLPNVLLMVI